MQIPILICHGFRVDDFETRTGHVHVCTHESAVVNKRFKRRNSHVHRRWLNVVLTVNRPSRLRSRVVPDFTSLAVVVSKFYTRNSVGLLLVFSYKHCKAPVRIGVIDISQRTRTQTRVRIENRESPTLQIKFVLLAVKFAEQWIAYRVKISL